MLTNSDSYLARWMRENDGQGQEQPKAVHAAPWYATLWLTGVDYFSSLGYAPGLAILASGFLAPVATLLLVALTFCAALPVYIMVARHSPDGEGSIKMTERLTANWGRLGWVGKALVLTLLGFAMTDFVITITLSSADATHHILSNPLLEPYLPNNPVILTNMLICGLCLVFLKGFREAIWLCVIIAVPYMALNAVIIVVGAQQILANPHVFSSWWGQVTAFQVTDLRAYITATGAEGMGPVGELNGGGFAMLVAVSLLVFPKLALGLSGFETGVSVMLMIKADNTEQRIANTRKLLTAAALLMTTELLGANLVATLLIPAEAFHPAYEGAGGSASGRALAWLAHTLMGHTLGTIYDLITVMILWFAGASAMAGLLNIIPRYLPRFGMSPTWLEYRRPLVLVITLMCLLVTFWFNADVEAQGGAYATGVLVLMTSDAFAVSLAERARPTLRLMFTLIFFVFAYVLVVNAVERPDGLKIASVFIGLTVTASIWSRFQRSSELRVPSLHFTDSESERLWIELQNARDVALIPLRTSTPEIRANAPARQVRHHSTPTTRYAFLHVSLVEDTSQFQSPLRVTVRRDGEDYIIEARDAVAVANAIAYTALTLGVREVIIGLIDNGTPIVNALLYVAFGTGEVGYAVRAIFMRIREEWLDHQNRLRRHMEQHREFAERELLRDLVTLSNDDRKTRVHDMFVEEEKRFAQSLPALPHLPHLILYE